MSDRARTDRGGGDATVVRVSGRLTEGHGLAAALTDVLRERHHVVADVSALVPGPGADVDVFVRALDDAGEWPTVALVLAAPGPDLAARLDGPGDRRRVPVHPDVPTALARVGERPPLVRAGWDFGVDPRAPGDARVHVRRVCAGWEVGADAREAAEIVVTELVTNAVEHAGSPTEVAVARSADVLRMTVRDYEHRALPEVALPGPRSPRGRGLAMVAAVAQRWGVDTHPDGKTIWAEIGLPPG